jgi:formiminotetrahydrofolate cyclodeaminase
MAASFLDQSARDLLERFGAGKTTPGAGSAAALAGALAGSLLQSVARYTIQEAAKKGDAALHARAEEHLGEAHARSARLRLAVDEDAAVFERYWRQGRRDEDLERATRIPLEIAEDCLALAELGRELAARGFKNARGEAVAATLSALAQGEAALEISRLNLKPARDAPWALEIADQIRRLGSRLSETRAAFAAAP